MRRALLLTTAILSLCTAASPSRAQGTLIAGGFGGELERALRTCVSPKFEADDVRVEYAAANPAQVDRGKINPHRAERTRRWQREIER